MWKTLLLVLFVVLILNLKKQESVSTCYSITTVSDSSWVTSSVTQAWVNYYASQGIKFGLVVFAQFTWETDWMRSEVFKHNHNGYGMKYRPNSKYALCEQLGHACYRNHADSVKDYARWQKRLLHAHPEVDTDEEYLRLLDDYNVPWCPNCRYAEDPNYTTRIRQRMRYLASL